MSQALPSSFQYSQQYIPPSSYPDPTQSTFSSQQAYTRSPPLPPPKSGQSQTHAGPPLPPTPTQIAHNTFQHPSTQHPQFTPIPQPTPAIEEYWLPEILQDKSKPDLETLLHSPPLQSALTLAPSTTHPLLPTTISTLHTALSTNHQTATHLNTLSTELTSLRTTLTTRLLSLHALERQWRHKQSDMDRALEPWSPKVLHAKLVASIGEQDMLCRALEESFLENQDGRASEREIADWVKRYREGRMVLGLRQERRARFEEGRVGGWR